MRRLVFVSTMTLVLAGCAAQSDESTTMVGTPVVRDAAAVARTSVGVPPEVSTRIGTLRFEDGLPDRATVKTVYEHLDFLRGVRTYLHALPAVSMYAMREGIYSADGLPNYTVLLSESLIDARSRFLAMDTETVYATVWISLKGGPIVVETPPRTLGVFDDIWQRHLADTGYPGPDRGKGGRYVIVPPAYDGYVPNSPFLVQSPTFGVWAIFQGFVVEGSTETAIANFKEHLKIYPLKESERPPPNQFVDISGRAFDTLPPTDFAFFEALDAVVQEEPRESQDPDVLGLFASIGIEKDGKFEPDESMRGLLAEAAAVGNATARTLLMSPRAASASGDSGSQWETGSAGGDYQFLQDHGRRLDDRTRFYYGATAHETAQVDDVLGKRSERAIAFRDAQGKPLDGGKTYRLTLPANVPAKTFWSLVVYDNDTRSMLQTDQRFPSVNTAQIAIQKRPPVAKNDDGSTTIYFGPEAPAEASALGGRGGRSRRSGNWIQTIPGRGWHAILRVYGPLPPWYEHTWRPGEFEPMTEVPSVSTGARPPAMATPLPAALSTPAKVETRLGVLEFELGLPTAQTAERLYSNLDFIRGVDAFLVTIPWASQVALGRGLRSAGLDDPSIVGLFDKRVDPQSELLTASPDAVYAFSRLNLREGAAVVRGPAKKAGVATDVFGRPLSDLGPNGPGKGEGGLFLFTPPDYEGQISERYFSFESATFDNLLQWQAVSQNGDPLPIAEFFQRRIQIYPFDIDFDQEFNFDEPDPQPEPVAGTTTPDGESDPSVDDFAPDVTDDETRFVSLSGVPMSTIPPSDLGFYEMINESLQREPPQAFGPETLGLLASVGLRPGSTFAPAADMSATLTESAAVATATARALAFRPRNPEAYLYDGLGWFTSFTGNSSVFLRSGARLLDARTTFFYLDTGLSSTRVSAPENVYEVKAFAATDSRGEYLDGAKTYTLRLARDVPARALWSVAIYDPQTRSLRATPEGQVASVGAATPGLIANSDGSTTIYFGPRPPAGREANWIQTMPDERWFAVFRLYEPLRPWFDQTWRPGAIVLDASAPTAR